jgi:hypothetical protein
VLVCILVSFLVVFNRFVKPLNTLLQPWFSR